MFWTFNRANIDLPPCVNCKVRRYLVIWIGIFCFGGLYAQGDTSPLIQPDTSVNRQGVVNIQLQEDFIPVPKKALLYSLVLPGAGQVYNRKYWKLPLVLGAYGGLIYAFDFNGTQHNRFKQAYQYRIDGNPLADELVNPAVSTDAIKRVRDSTRKNLELTYMAAIVVHALNGIEAFVDAHLRNFDVSEDLSFSIRPTFDTSSTVGIQSGVGLFVTF